MKLSPNRILTTHTGSLPRPTDLIELIQKVETGGDVSPEAFEARVKSAVAETVQKQVDAGITVINDGEAGKPGYSPYVKDRLTGFGGTSRNTNINAEGRDFPEWLAKRNVSGNVIARPACDGPVAWRDFAAVEREIANLKAAVAGQPYEDVFMSAASPGVIATFLPNEYYPSHEKYIEALAGVMHDEYKAIVDAGFVLQLDCPDLAMTRHNRHIDKTLAEFRDICELHIAAINEATKDIPAESMRLHLCWGNYEGPHHMDVAMTDIIDIVLKGRPAGISFEGANPRHEHEWKVWREVDASGRVVIPGVIDSTSNFIEHPELVAQRIVKYAECVGKENVIAGTDCGFGTFATSDAVDHRIAWAKLKTLAEGARIASEELY
jgi:5-methyltetrahydropteroyltriglutamate--homocysteine methyltransferase